MSDTIRDLIDRRSHLRGLLLHPGWKILVEDAAIQRAFHLQVLEQPLPSQEAVYAQEFSKGRAYQLGCLAGAPKALIDNLSIDIQTIQQETGNGTERSPDDTDDSGTDADVSSDRAP